MSGRRWLVGMLVGLAIFTATAPLDGDWSNAPLWGLVLAEVVMTAIWWPALRKRSGWRPTRSPQGKDYEEDG